MRMMGRSPGWWVLRHETAALGDAAFEVPLGVIFRGHVWGVVHRECVTFYFFWCWGRVVW